MLNDNDKEMQSKTIVSYHFIPTGMAIIKKLGYNKCWGGWGEIETFVYCWWRCKMVQRYGKQSGKVGPQKVKHRVTI